MHKGGIVLRDYQARTVAEVRSAYAAGSRAVLLVLPTGGGKTIIFSYVAASAIRLGRRVLVVCHRRELIRQASEKLALAGVEHGIIAPGHHETADAVQVASIQTLARRLHRIGAFDLIVFDEAHHAVAGQWAQLIKAQPRARILGLTATAERLDGKGLGVEAGGPFDCLVIGPSVQELIRGGFLSRSRVFAPDRCPDLSGIPTKKGDYAVDALNRVMSATGLVGDAVKHYVKHAPGQPAIAFCVSVAHAEKTAAAFRDAGWRSVAVHGGMPPKARDAAIAGLGTGEVQVLTSCSLISEGLDVPAVGCVILLRPTQSLAMHLQQIGRGLRPAPGKSHLVVLDHAGNTIRHGFAEDSRAWSLEGREKHKGETPVLRCPECDAVHNVATVCPECGYAYPGQKAQDDPDAELREITERERLLRLRTMPLRKLLTGKETREQLEEIRLIRGYHAGWVHYTLAGQYNGWWGT